LREGADPGLRGKATLQQEEAVAPEIFRTVALEWFERKMPDKKESYTGRSLGPLDNELFLFLKDGLSPTSRHRNCWRRSDKSILGEQ
jgi:hypothetical protein